MPEFYRLLASVEPPRTASVVVRSPLPVAEVAARIRADIAALDPTLPVRIETLEERVAGMVVRPRFNAALMGGFAAAGLLLAVVGIYGAVAFLVAQRTRTSASAWRWEPRPQPLSVTSWPMQRAGSLRVLYWERPDR